MCMRCVRFAPDSGRMQRETKCQLWANSGHSAVYSITSSARASSGRRHGEAERLGSLEIDYQLVLGRRLHRQVGGLLALENAIDIGGRATVLVNKIRPIGDQAAVGGEARLV